MAITNPDHVVTWTGYNGTADDQVFLDAWNAAEQYVANRCTWPTVDVTGQPVAPPGDLVQAVNLLTARYLDRRNSPNGVVGLGDLGAVTLPSADVDVKALLGPYRRVVFG